MRLDYALYSLAVILFVLAAVTYLLVADDYKFVYVASTAIVGVLVVVGGYFLRPKTAAADAPAKTEPTPQAVIEAPDAQPVQPIGGSIVEAPTTQLQVAEEPKMNVPAVQAPPTISASKPETEPIPTPVPATPVTEVAPSVNAGSVAPVQSVTEELTFSQIRGISRNRADQLKTMGINSLADLARASPEDLASKLSVSPKIVKMWIGSAKKLAK